MRSVFTFLPNCTREEVESLLGFSIPGRNAIDPEWEAIVSVYCYADAEVEMPEICWLIQEKLGSKPFYLAADITGRMEGAKEATALCIKMLERFGGYAMDDYSDHLWTLDKLRHGGTYNGHLFFDTVGWYEEK